MRHVWLAAMLAVLGVGNACAPRMLRAQGEHGGYIVVRWPTSEAFGLPRGDTLPEIERSGLPPEVIAAANRFVEGGVRKGVRWDAACTRFFRAPDFFVALFAAICGPPTAGIRHNGEALGAFLPDGELVIPPARFRGYDVHFDVRPLLRDRAPGIGETGSPRNREGEPGRARTP